MTEQTKKWDSMYGRCANRLYYGQLDRIRLKFGNRSNFVETQSIVLLLGGTNV